MQTAVENAYDAGILLIAASGNNASDVEYPAAFPEVMAVAATNTVAQITEYSNTGDELEIAAPGEKIKATGFFGGQIVTHGTSIAVPHVTGAASLLWQKDTTKSNEFIRQLLIHSTKNIDNSNECGLLDVDFALGSYDDFATNWNGTAITHPKRLSKNDDTPETFEEIDNDNNYVEGLWRNAEHKALAGSMAVVKAGAIFPDHDPFMDILADCPEYHEGYTYLGVTVNYIACYELMTNVALNKGSASGLKLSDGWGINSDVLSWFKGNFTSTYCGSRTWNSVLSSYGNTAANRKYFSWGMAMHILGDIFTHKTYRKKDGKLIVDDSQKEDSTKMHGADKINIVIRRYKVASKACSEAVKCMNSGTYGDYLELDYGLNKAPAESNDLENFLKKKLLVFAQENSGGLTTAQTKRFTEANQN